MNIENFKIIEVRLFGSHARGNAQATSDTDILHVVDTTKSVDEVTIDYLVKERSDSRPNDTSTYSNKRIQDMFKEGHLFAWHLYLESKYLWSPDGNSFIKSLGAPSKYVAHKEDALNFSFMAQEARNALEAPNGNVIYELGILYVCMRNVALIVSTILCESPIFGPLSPTLVEVSELPFPLTTEQYELTIFSRHATTRGITPKQIDRSSALIIAKKAELWVCQVVDWIIRVQS